jgi:hypothetical protein
MMRTLAVIFSLAVAVATTAAGASGCASHKSAGSSARPSSTAAAGTCGRKPLLCVDGFEQCTMGPDGCETCTCTKAGGFNSLDPRMPP